MFYEIRFPESISIKSTTSINFNTNITSSKNGKEHRIINRSESIMIYDIVSGIKSKQDIEEVIKLFRLVKGRAIGFRYKDWLDYSATKQQIDIGDGEKIKFQLLKTYTDINNRNIKYVREIKKPVENTVKICLNNNSNKFFDVDYTNGIITFEEAPTNGTIITASFEFDVPVRFDSDELEISLESLNSGKIKNIRLVEII